MFFQSELFFLAYSESFRICQKEQFHFPPKKSGPPLNECLMRHDLRSYEGGGFLRKRQNVKRSPIIIRSVARIQTLMKGAGGSKPDFLFSIRGNGVLQKKFVR